MGIQRTSSTQSPAPRQLPVRDCKVPIGLRAGLEALGVSPAAVCNAAGLPGQLLEQATARTGIESYFRLWQAIAMVAKDPAIGIKLGAGFRADQTEPLLLAVMSASSVCQALEVLSVYKRVLCPEDVLLEAHPSEGEHHIIKGWPANAGAPPQVLVDCELAFMVELCRRATGKADLKPRAVLFLAASVDPDAGHAQYFGCAIVCNARRNTIIVDDATWTLPFVTCNPEMLAALTPYLQQNLAGGADPTLERVRAVVARRLRGQRPTVTSVAKDLAMSPRALQRFLNHNGASFRGLLDDLRREHAQRYLTATAFTDGEVAFLLGFEDPNSFYRAFRTWNGMTPSEFRRKLAS